MELRIEHLAKTYPNGVHALHDVTLTIPRGLARQTHGHREAKDRYALSFSVVGRVVTPRFGECSGSVQQ